MLAVRKLLRSIIGIIFLLCSTGLLAANYSQTKVSDEQFLLLDIKTKDLHLLEAIDAYGIENKSRQVEQVLLPLASLLQALEMDFVVSSQNATIKLRRDDTEFNIDLLNQTQSGPLEDNIQPYLWSNSGSELLVSHLLVEHLIDATLTLNYGALSILIENAKVLFPVEMRLEREETRRNAIRPTQRNSSDKLASLIFADEFILDTYQLASKPYIYNNFNVISNGGENSHTDISNTLQSNFDLLYHSTSLTLNQQSDDDIATNLTFSRHQASPYENFALGIQEYSFGDVFGQADNLTSSSKTGIGLSVERRPVNYSRNFGSVTLEDFAPPGWEIELYRGGILLTTANVPDDGRYIFEDVETVYGFNRFEVKLYGPHGEEEIQYKNIRVDSTQLKQSEYGFDGFILDANNKLLDGINGDAESFEPDTFGFSWDYGVTNDMSWGINLAQTKDVLNNNQQFIGTGLQTSIPGALFDISVSHEIGQGYAAIAAVSGLLWEDTTYQINYTTSSDYHQQNSNSDEDLISASVSGRFSNIAYNNSFVFNHSELTDSITASNRLSGRLSNLNLTHFVNYLKIKSNISSAINSESLTGDLTVTGRLNSGIRISGGLTYDMKDNAKINLFRLSTGMNLSETINLNSQIDYRPLSDVKWRVNNALSWSSPSATVYSSLAYDANDQWSIGLGISFSLGYDDYEDNWFFDSQNITAGGTLDVNSYLDQNNNRQLDEGDVALPSVSYGHLRQWENIRSNNEGKAMLPFVATYTPTRFSPTSTFGVVPSSSTYAVYTHPGSRIKAQIPFSVRTSVSGFVILDDEDGDPLVSAKVALTNIADKTDYYTSTDEDGYFEFNDIWPGDYVVKIDETALNSRELKSNPSKVTFSTLPAGGFLELGVLAAVPLSEENIIEVRETKATIYNYEPIAEIERLLGLDKERENEFNNAAAPIQPNNNSPTLLTSRVLSAHELPIATDNPTVELEKAVVLSDKVAQDPLTSNYNDNQAIPKRWALQLASFSSEKGANDMLFNLRQENINPISVFDSGTNTFRILSGPYLTRTIARDTSDQLKLRGMNNFLRVWPENIASPSEITEITSNSEVIAPSNLPENGYTIQLMVTANQQTIEKIIQTQMNAGAAYKDLYQIEKRSSDRPTYAVLKGYYLDRQLAEQDLMNVPAQFKGKTWIRSLSDIRAEYNTKD